VKARFINIAAIAAIAVALLTGAAREEDFVNGTLIQFKENGARSWFQDERALLDDCKMLNQHDWCTPATTRVGALIEPGRSD
jgi:hypothetical protein